MVKVPTAHRNGLSLDQHSALNSLKVGVTEHSVIDVAMAFPIERPAGLSCGRLQYGINDYFDGREVADGPGSRNAGRAQNYGGICELKQIAWGTCRINPSGVHRKPGPCGVGQG